MEKFCGDIAHIGEPRLPDSAFRVHSGQFGLSTYCKVCEARREAAKRHSNPLYKSRGNESCRMNNNARYATDASFRDRQIANTRARHARLRLDPKYIAQRCHRQWRARWAKVTRFLIAAQLIQQAQEAGTL